MNMILKWISSQGVNLTANYEKKERKSRKRKQKETRCDSNFRIYAAAGLRHRSKSTSLPPRKPLSRMTDASAFVGE